MYKARRRERKRNDRENLKTTENERMKRPQWEKRKKDEKKE